MCWRYGGGGPTYTHTWPIQTISRQESPFVSGDFIETKSEEMYGGVSENYWLLTSGVALHVDEDVPLRLSVIYFILNATIIACTL